MLSTLFYFFIALILLITVHEMGHFLVARWCGVKVLRFSFGFGKVIARWHDKKGTEYAWSAFPLGGYVKMLDESEGDVTENEQHLAFNRKSVWARIAIVLAGPLFNLIFAFFALWLMWVIGIKTLAPIIGQVQPGSIAAKAGLKAHQEIVAFNNKKITSWRDFQYAMMPFLGTHEVVTLQVKSPVYPQSQPIELALNNWTLEAPETGFLESIGIKPFVPTIPPVIGEVASDSPAEKAGLLSGDHIVAFNGKPLTDWLQLVEKVKQIPNQSLELLVIRHQKKQAIRLQVGSLTTHGQLQGFLGIRPKPIDWPANWLRIQRYNPIKAAQIAGVQTIELTQTTFKMIGRLVMGILPLKSLSGPVGIAQGAGESARSGLAYYLAFLALVSVSLGVLNLLPIPMLDGGHLLYYFLEILLGRPLSDGIKSIGLYVGLVLLMALMAIALTNDLTRLTGL